MTIANDLKHLRDFAKTYLGNIVHTKYEFRGHRCNFLEAGQGEKIIMLHGNATTKTYWRQIMQLLAPSYHCIALDVPGYILEDSNYWNRFTFKHMNLWLTESLQAINVNENETFHLVGYCSGAAVAAYYSATHPERVRSLTMLSIPSIYVNPHLSLSERKGLLESRWVENEEQFYEALKSAFVEPPYVPALAVRKYIQNMRGKRGLFNQMVEDTCNSAPLLISKLAHINIPVLSMTGDRDSLSPICQMNDMRAIIPQIQSHVVPRCCHLSLIEQPEIIASHLSKFLKDI